MKKSKLLFLTPLLAIAPIATISSCGEQPMDAEWVADAIFGPIEKTPTPVEDTLVDELYNLDSDGRAEELIYNLYYFTNIVEPKLLIGNKTMNELYKDQTVGIKSVIKQAAIGITKEENAYTEFYASFLGYVSFVFLKEYQGDFTFKVNDYIMITYDFKRLKLSIDTSNGVWGIMFNSAVWLGVIKYRFNGGESEGVIPIKSLSAPSDALQINIGIVDNIPHNGHNWGSKAG